LIQPLCNIFTSAAKMLLQYWEQVVISRWKIGAVCITSASSMQGLHKF
jgi:hypothetical protein